MQLKQQRCNCLLLQHLSAGVGSIDKESEIFKRDTVSEVKLTSALSSELRTGWCGKRSCSTSEAVSAAAAFTLWSNNGRLL